MLFLIRRCGNLLEAVNRLSRAMTIIPAGDFLALAKGYINMASILSQMKRFFFF